MKIQFFKTEKHFKKSDSQINPDIYWRVVLYVVGLLIIFFFIFGFFLFTGLNKTEDVSFSPENSSAQTVKKSRIDKVLKFFSERQDNFENIKNSIPAIVDPSL